MLFRSILLTLFFTVLLSAQQKPVVVLELFTSQGCSSCPPADKLLEEIKNTYNPSEVIPLSYHVDYWDYIGWKDPYASKKFTHKQRIYAQKFFSSSIYTPQLVINAKEHLVGSDKVKIINRIKQLLQKKNNTNIIKIKNAVKQNNKVDFSYQINGDTKRKKIHFLLVLNERITKIKNGENRNRTLTNNNIVITEEIKPITSSKGNYQLSIPKTITEKDTLKLIILISDESLDINTGVQYNL